jgi:RNA polymerase sigma-70 factor, ECF subfamily
VVNELAADLIHAARAGDTDAFANILAHTEQSVYNLAYSVLGNPQEAQDMAQEVFLRVWQALPGYRGESSFRTWLYRVTLNTCLNRRRRLRSELQQVDGDEVLATLSGVEPDPAAEAIHHMQRERLWARVDRLAEKYRVVIVLFYQEQLSYDEIAQLLALPLGTVKAHLSRARGALARQLRQESEEKHDVL